MTNQNLLSKKLKKLTINSILNGSLHGLPNVLRSERNIFKIIWTIALLLSGSYCFYSASESISEYLKWSVITNIHVVYDVNISFPAVTICNLNPNLTIEQMLLTCENPLGSCHSHEFVPTKIYSNIIDGTCYTLNMGRNAYNQSLDLLKPFSPQRTIDLEIFTGVQADLVVIDGKNVYSNGLHVILHSQEHYAEYYTGFYVSSGKFLT